MAKRTLTTTWRNIERLVQQHARRNDNKKLEELNNLFVRINNSNIVEALATLLINPHHGFEKTSLRFALLENNQPPPWKTYYSPEEDRLYINVLGIFDFREECETASRTLTTPEARKSFHLYRYNAFMAELAKLPNQLMLFLLIFQELANVLDISRVVKRGGESEESEGRYYLQYLWGFKELESFMKTNKGIDLRSEYGILWLESDWFVGR